MPFDVEMGFKNLSSSLVEDFKVEKQLKIMAF